MKTNKSFTKRIKVTKKGKLLARKPGGSHFNAKESREKQLDRKKKQKLALSNKAIERNLPHE